MCTMDVGVAVEHAPVLYVPPDVKLKNRRWDLREPMDVGFIFRNGAYAWAASACHMQMS